MVDKYLSMENYFITLASSRSDEDLTSYKEASYG